MNARKTYQFSLILSGVDIDTPNLEDSLFEAGCDDALINSSSGTVYLDFDRESESLESAIISAIKNVESSSVKPKVSSVNPSYLVTISEIARRIGISRQAVSQLACGSRGDGTFPKPVIGVDDKSSLWRWKDVIQWFFNEKNLADANAVNAATIIDDINVVLEFRPADAKIKNHRENILKHLGYS